MIVTLPSQKKGLKTGMYYLVRLAEDEPDVPAHARARSRVPTERDSFEFELLS